MRPRGSRSATGWARRPQITRELRRTPCYVESMDREITQRELRNESGSIMREVDQGASFVVTRAGVPVAHLIPLRRKRFVRTEAALATFRSAPAIDAATFRRDVDALADQDATPRA